ncbi:TNF receptor-associated factor 5-like [Acropora palmata]|uniref:TNF receptor-associated factor 5-like n=1 Tax=Acropora palmata TaxID=6131 RepID=UPI003D9FCCEB
MRSPVQTKCGHRFCKVCLEKYLTRETQLCPLDRSALNPLSLTDIYLDLAIERTILDLYVKCPHDKNGCKWTGEVRSVEEHEAHCSFIVVKCRNKGCKETPLLKDLKEHLTKKCLRRKEMCQYCKRRFIFCKGKEHFDECAKYPVPLYSGVWTTHPT